MINLDRIVPRTDKEIRQQQKVDRIRQCESLRKERFFNAKNRLMGKDSEALERQIQEKKMIAQLEKENDKAFLKKLMNDTQIATSLEKRSNELRKQTARDIDVYRLNEQRKEQVREYDLNDSKSITNQLPMRVEGITDPRELTMMSFLTFPNEENHTEREKAMKKHLWQGLAKQISENFQNKKSAIIENLHCGQDVMRTDELVNRKMEEEKKIRTESDRQIMEYNLRKAKYETEKKKLEKRMGIEDGIAHINTCLESDFYKEDRSVMKSSLGIKKLIPYCHKGMTQEEIKLIQQEQLEQVEERKKIIEAEKAYDTFWAVEDDMQCRVKHIKELAEENKKKQLAKNVQDENMKLAAVQAIKREEAKRMATHNFPTNEYFDLFNTTSR